MRKLWHDIQTHQLVSVLFLVYWLASTVFALNVWFDTTRGAVLLATSPLIAGALVGWWRSSERIRGGVLAGVLSGALASLAMDVSDVIRWIQHGRVRGFQLDEVLGFLILLVVVGALLGLAGAVLAIILDRLRRHGRPAPSTECREPGAQGSTRE